MGLIATRHSILRRVRKSEIFYQIDEIIFFSLKHQHILQTFTFSVFEIPGRSRKVMSTSVSVIFTTTVSILLEKFFSRRWPRHSSSDKLTKFCNSCYLGLSWKEDISSIELVFPESIVCKRCSGTSQCWILKETWQCRAESPEMRTTSIGHLVQVPGEWGILI